MSHSSRQYPGSKLLPSRWIAQILKFTNVDGDEVYSINPVNQIISGPRLVNTIRSHATIAAINAGFTLLPAVVGYKYRMVECLAIAVGGNVTSVTTVDVKGVQSSLVKLVAFAQAQLTRSAVLRTGATGAAVLADAASFDPCDANTAITVDITDSDITVATHVDFIFSFVLEAA